MENRKGGRFPFIAAAAVLIGSAGAAPLATAQNWPQFYNPWSGLCMDNFARTGNVVQWDCNEQGNQGWHLDVPGPTWVLLQEFRQTDGKRLCLSVTAPTIHTTVKAADCFQPGFHRDWHWVAFDDFRAMLRLHGTNLCVAAPAQGVKSDLFLWECIPNTETLWMRAWVNRPL
jgi:hypothetical protein